MFKFRLEPLLKYRKRQEEEKQRELALVTMEFLQARNSVDKLTVQRKGAAKKLTELSEKADNVNVLRLYGNFIMGSDNDVTTAKKELEKAGGRVTAKQAELLEYVSKRRSLELMREKKRLSYMDEEKRKERLFTDEIASQMWHRRAFG